MTPIDRMRIAMLKEANEKPNMVGDDVAYIAKWRVCGDKHVGWNCRPLKSHVKGCRYYEEQRDTKCEPDRQFVLDLEQQRASDRGYSADDRAVAQAKGTAKFALDGTPWPPEVSKGSGQQGDRTPALESVLAERQRQDMKWGVQDHHPDRWLRILTEEIGEWCGEVDRLEQKSYNVRKLVRAELVQIVAVGLAMLECWDRGNDGTKRNANEDAQFSGDKYPTGDRVPVEHGHVELGSCSDTGTQRRGDTGFLDHRDVHGK